METNIIPKNLHYNSPNNELHNGKLEVARENLSLNGEYIGINNFGFGGTNAHVLLKKHPIITSNGSENNVADIALYSSRDSTSVKEDMEKISKYERNFQALMINANLMAGKAKVRAYTTESETSAKTIVCNIEKLII